MSRSMLNYWVVRFVNPTTGEMFERQLYGGMTQAQAIQAAVRDLESEGWDTLGLRVIGAARTNWLNREEDIMWA